METIRQNPLREAIEPLAPAWGVIGEMETALHVGEAARESAALQELAMADVSPLRRWGLKGPGAEAYVRSKGVAVPDAIYGIEAASSAGGLAARLGTKEFFYEDGVDSDTASTLSSEPIPAGSGCISIYRQDASIIVCGDKLNRVVAQTCGVAVAKTPDRVLLTRMAAVPVMLLYRTNPARLRIWCDASYGAYLWSELFAIITDEGGAVVGWDAVKRLL